MRYKVLTAGSAEKLDFGPLAAYGRRQASSASRRPCATAWRRRRCDLHSIGITSLTDPGIDAATLTLMRGLVRERKLAVRLNVLLSAGASLDSAREALAAHRPLRGVDERRLRVAGRRSPPTGSQPRRRPPG